jgi:hypothetical protein
MIKSITATKIVAVGFGYDPKTHDWTKPITYDARDRMEAIRWINFNRNWLKNCRIESSENVEPVR